MGVVAGQAEPEGGEQGLGQDAQDTLRSTLRLTAEERASAQNAWMISARRCSMVIRRAYR